VYGILPKGMLPVKLPDIWGGGQLFAFSGLEGPTSWAHPLVGNLLDDAIAIDFHQDPPVVLEIVSESGETPAVTPRVVLGDCFELDVAAGPSRAREDTRAHAAPAVCKVACADRYTIVGALPQGLRVGLRDQPDELPTNLGFVCLARREGRFALALDPDRADQARTRAEEALAADLDALLRHRREFVEAVDTAGLHEPSDERTYRKAASVLKVNAMAPEGSIRRRWTTPDRWPHRHMWLWDSCFHALGWRHLDGEMAQDTVAAMVEAAYADGMIPLCSAPEPTPYQVSQPPLLAWTAWEVGEAAGDAAFAGTLYDGLVGYIEWFLRERDRNRNGLLDWWKDESNTLCHCGESGWDNSPRFDEPGLDDHLDLSCMIVNELDHLSRIALQLQRETEAAQWQRRARELAALINERMWDEETGFYHDLRADGTLLSLKTAAGFLPMWAGIAGPERCARLVEHLRDEREFATAFPVPTVAADEPSFSDDMWRGPTWINVNYLIWRGLVRNGFAADARGLREVTLREIQRWYEQTGAIHEYYDCLGKTAPGRLHRKGGVGSRGGYGVGTIGDYGWSAALYVSLAREA
jgi:glycogen debranching enzyme